MKNLVSGRLLFKASNNFFDLAKDIAGTFHEDGVFQLSSKAGSGSLREIITGDRLSAGLVDMTLSDKTHLHRKAQPVGPRRLFTLFFTITPETFILAAINQHRQFTVHGMHTALFVSDNTHLEFEVIPGQPVKLLYFRMSGDCIEECFASAPPYMKEAIHEIIHMEKPVVLQEAYADDEFAVISHFFTELGAAGKETASLRESSEEIAKKFFTKILQPAQQELQGVSHTYFEKMALVENILLQHITTRLPPIDSIARQVALSESTLKRYFRIVFGKTIYDYYLFKKMQYARSLLEEAGATVNEVAERVGYEKVSSFTNAFKKYTGLLPGSLKKR